MLQLHLSQNLYQTPALLLTSFFHLTNIKIYTYKSTLLHLFTLLNLLLYCGAFSNLRALQSGEEENFTEKLLDFFTNQRATRY